VNIFGGIVRCDLIAEGIIQAVREVQVSVPVVVRLEGTNAAQGLAMLARQRAGGGDRCVFERGGGQGGGRRSHPPA
jgi:succinyl-CoA synthetase beta subunit